MYDTTYNLSKTILMGPGVGIELGRVIHWAQLSMGPTLGPGADIELRRLLN